MKKTSLFSKKNLIRVILIVASYVLLTVLLRAGILNRQYTSLIVPIMINIILAVSLNLVTGFLGELSLGHACFMSVGAYTSALITLNAPAWGLPNGVAFAIALLLGGIVAGIFGILIGIPVLRLHGDYLAIVTLAFGEIIKSVLNALSFTNGAKGLSKIPTYSNAQHYTLVFVLTMITIIVICNIVDSKHGRAICSIRDNYIAAESVGVNVSKFKVMAFAIGAFFAGIAGVIYAHNVSIIKPTTFDYNKSIEILVIVVLGGMGSIKGSVIAAVVLTILPEMLRGIADYRMLIYAVVLIAIMIFNESGLKGNIYENIGKKLKKSNKETAVK